MNEIISGGKNPSSIISKREMSHLSEQQIEFIYVLTHDYTVHSACRAVGIPRSLFIQWCEENPLFKEKIDEYKEALIDNAEKNLHKLADSGHFLAIKFILECHGRARGWGKPLEADEDTFTPQITLAEGKLLGFSERIDELKRSGHKKFEKVRKEKRKKKLNAMDGDNNGDNE